MAGGHLRKGRIITKFNDSQFSNKYDIKHQQKYKQEQAVGHVPSSQTLFLTDTEKEEFFWAKLVTYGWKLGTYSYETEEHVSLILCCQECDQIFEDFKTVTYEQARLISAEWYAEQMMKHHDCKAISEAIPKDY